VRQPSRFEIWYGRDEPPAQTRELTPPLGHRGVGILYRDDWVDGNVAATMEQVNREVLLIAQVETAEGVERADEIAAVDGIDVLWVGHYDLTTSLGIPGQFGHESYHAAVERSRRLPAHR
jgi:2-keto-3-deoxy-L-rhamnonate aldolase RhmA